MEFVIMNHDVLDIKDYLMICKQEKNFLSFFVFLLCIFFCGFILIFKIDIYYKIEGYVFDDLLIVTIPIDDLDKITNGKYLYIDDKKYKYSIYEIKEEVMSYEQGLYKELKLKVNLDEKMNYDYNVIKAKFERKKQGILKMIFYEIKEGL